jgi:hypothetical protein
MSHEELILTELAETRAELQQLKALLLAMTGKPTKKAAPKKLKKSVEEYRQELQISHLKKQLK